MTQTLGPWPYRCRDLRVIHGASPLSFGFSPALRGTVVRLGIGQGTMARTDMCPRFSLKPPSRSTSPGPGCSSRGVRVSGGSAGWLSACR